MPAAYETGEPKQIIFVPDPVAWTEVPDRLRVLARQRDRWQRGLADVLSRHRGLMLGRRYGWLGLVVVPYFVFVELLAPLFEVLGLITVVLGLIVGAINWPFALLFLLVAYGWGLLLSVAAVCVDEWTYRSYGGFTDELPLVAYAAIEGFGYRQLTALWRVRGLWRHARGRSDWGVMTRRGFSGSRAGA
jgi:cellulose synthase/poly-beta-1,6-N-acetylglucosamine synthase-like glycosyltransferase